MQLALTDDQAMVAQTATAFIAEHASIARLRQLRDTQDERGYSLEVYRQMAELGWTAMPFTEDAGGLDMGLAGTILVTEAMGRALAPEPLIPSIVLAAQALIKGANASLKQAWLSSAIAGEKVLALAYQERGSRYHLHHCTTRATLTDTEYVLKGEKVLVAAGPLADAFVVVARTSGDETEASGLTMFLIPSDTPGLRVSRQWLVDSSSAARVALNDVRVGSGAIIGNPDDALPLLQAIIDGGTVALCGEMLGGMCEAYDRTIAYLKERKQFDTVLGSFQALKHRAAYMFIEIELARSATMAAARAMDSGAPQAKALVSAAKARCSDAYIKVANEAVQMHGGICMTDENEIGFFLKRARTTEMTFGDAAYHRNRFARLGGY
ncbi:acyl-CoA dehydrogenase [Candidatus Entotheonella serta]|nr:acyl-CoA dehydrogenase [Candidatus Entotheonella serta]